VSDLVSRLGYPSDARLLILSCTNLGQAHGANVAVYESLRQGLATTASLMVPCPWARDAAERFHGEDVGVQITLNAELDRYRWGPVTMSPSLIDGDGGFPRTRADLWDHADLDELRRECRAQVERAILWGFDVTHLSVHLDALQQRPEFFDIYLDLACEYLLPIELPSGPDEIRSGFPARALAAEEGVVFADYVVDIATRPSRTAFEYAMGNLEPGVTLMRVRPALDAPEIRGLDPEWSRRVEDYLLVAHDPGAAAIVARSGASLIGYRELRALMRP
jgi:predicted glycoside hydrolase/deacetylase ChbG (UPF0249 family)